MRSLVLLAVLALCAAPLALGASGTWGIYADPGCNVALYTSTFEDGQCGTQSTGSGDIYFITACSDDGTQWVENEYEDAQCTKVVPDSQNSNGSGVCFKSGDYYGKVVCPKKVFAKSEEKPALASSPLADIAASLLGQEPVSAGAVAVPSIFAAFVAAAVALLA